MENVDVFAVATRRGQYRRRDHRRHRRAWRFGALWFTTLQENKKFKEERDEALDKVMPTEAKLHYAETGYSELAKVIGPQVPADLPKPESLGLGLQGRARSS